MFDEIDGHAPAMPWRADDLEHVMAAVTELSTALTPCPLDDVPDAADRLREDLTAYSRLSAAPPTDLDGWERRHLSELADLAEGTIAHLGGNTLVHFDIRADNIVLGNDGRVWFVDWPWACRGAIWMDITLFLVNAALYGHDPQAYADRHPLLADVDPLHVTGLLAGIAGMWAEEIRQPAPPGIPTLRAFQRAQLDATLPWIRRRTEWG